jgi:phosphate-selective porin OprO/OprP
MNVLHFLLGLFLLVPAMAQAEEKDPAPDDVGKGTKFNEFDLNFMTMRVGGGFLYDYANYSQDSESKQQMDLAQASTLRDLRLLLKGKIKSAPNVSYTLGYMYDGAQDDWRFRQTGIQINVPTWKGSLFIGRTKEGFSTNKMMVGYYGWTNERSAANDAFIPILADGMKWTGTGFDGKLVYNLGVFNEKITEYESYDKNDEVIAARGVWLPLEKEGKGQLLHLALEGRYGTSKNGFLQYRSKPESFPAQDYAVDTGKFPAKSSSMVGLEAYYRPGPLMFGSEYFFNKVDSKETNDPFFHGGEILAAYLLTGEVRPYNEKAGLFEAVSPTQSVFNGGKGAWELVLRYSYVDLDSGLINGGKFQRITPMVNWHLSDNARMEFVYGYSSLDREDVTGNTQYLQARLQLSL